MTLLADVFPDWVQLAGAIAIVLGAIGVLVWKLVQARNASRSAQTQNRVLLTEDELRREREEAEIEQDIGERQESFTIRNLKGIIRELRSRVDKEIADCDNRMRGLQREVDALRAAERKAYAESVRQGQVIKIMSQQIVELRRALKQEGVDVITSDHTPLPEVAPKDNEDGERQSENPGEDS